MEGVKFRIKVENMVASTTFDVDIPLEKLVKKYKEMEYEPEQFPGIVYRMDKPKAAALIFGSGKIVCTGARNLNDVKEVFRKVARVLRSNGVKVPRKYEVVVENIVAAIKFNVRFNLDRIAYGIETAEYEPEQFPGLVYRMDSPRVAFLLFTSGKVICTGARKLKDVRKAVEMLAEKLERIGAFVSE